MISTLFRPSPACTVAATSDDEDKGLGISRMSLKSSPCTATELKAILQATHDQGLGEGREGKLLAQQHGTVEIKWTWEIYNLNDFFVPRLKTRPIPNVTSKDKILIRDHL
ncbi:hypothetical protein NHQ30_011229 [Ciborinia camelliae]|nr:hypothetical protein NHQ30_011229 [Ciborinia camelliae]